MAPRRASLTPKLDPASGKWVVSIPPDISPTGQRMRKTLGKNEEQARAYCEKLKEQGDLTPWVVRAEPDWIGQAARLDSDLRDEFGVSLLEVGRLYQTENVQGLIRLQELAEAYERDIAPSWKSPKNKWRQLKGRLEPLWDRPINKLSTAFWAEWLAQQATERGWSATSFNDYRTVLSSLFKHAVGLEMLEVNPIDRVARRRGRKPTVTVFEVEEARLLLETAREHDEAMLPYFVIALFLGPRPDSELLKLRWEHFDWDRGWCEIASSKTEGTVPKRWPKLHDNLVAWLEPFRKESGTILPESPVRPGQPLTKKYIDIRRRAIAKTAGVEWARDITRHTYGSYLAAVTDREEVRRSMGHTDFKTFERHYQNARNPEEGVAYWGIVPEQ